MGGNERPGCEISDGEFVKRISFTPTFRCTSCGYVWDGSKARLIVLSLPPDPDDDDGIDDLVERLMEAASMLGTTLPSVGVSPDARR